MTKERESRGLLWVLAVLGAVAVATIIATGMEAG